MKLAHARLMTSECNMLLSQQRAQVLDARDNLLKRSERHL
jgi:hypothetical protein